MAFSRRLYPDRVTAWVMATAKKRGPVMVPQIRSVFVRTELLFQGFASNPFLAVH
jgi:hypothetical protein